MAFLQQGKKNLLPFIGISKKHANVCHKAHILPVWRGGDLNKGESQQKTSLNM